jgi:hypothetical protein
MAQQNPFTPGGAAENAFKAAYDRLKQQSELEKQNIGRDYSTAYQRLRQQGYGMGLGASAQRGLSGGQAAGVRAGLGAQQAQQLSSLMQGQETAFRQQKIGESSIYSNALLEGQQAQEMEMSNKQAALALQEKRNTIVADNSLSEQQKYDALIAAGADQNTAIQQSGLGDVQTYGEDKNTFWAAFGSQTAQTALGQYQGSIESSNFKGTEEGLKNYREARENRIVQIMNLMGITREQAEARAIRAGLPAL